MSMFKISMQGQWSTKSSSVSDTESKKKKTLGENTKRHLSTEITKIILHNKFLKPKAYFSNPSSMN